MWKSYDHIGRGNFLKQLATSKKRKENQISETLSTCCKTRTCRMKLNETK